MEIEELIMHNLSVTDIVIQVGPNMETGGCDNLYRYSKLALIKHAHNTQDVSRCQSVIASIDGQVFMSS